MNRRTRRRMFRLARLLGYDDRINELELDPRGRKELLDLLVNRSTVHNLDELLDSPFRHKQRRYRTRFSDGSFPVIYCSLEATTAEAELKHWIPKYAGNPLKSRILYYTRFNCMFNGIEKDLRPMISNWPGLIEDNDYSF